MLALVFHLMKNFSRPLCFGIFNFKTNYRRETSTCRNFHTYIRVRAWFRIFSHFTIRKPLKKYGNCFLFHLKLHLGSWDVEIFELKHEKWPGDGQLRKENF